MENDVHAEPRHEEHRLGCTNMVLVLRWSHICGLFAREWYGTDFGGLTSEVGFNSFVVSRRGTSVT